jgi:beta-barrel assembly-enhancing protease
MKQVIALAAVLLVAGAALYYAQRHEHSDAVSANAVVDAAADWQRDVSQVPMHLTRLSDRQEAHIGDELALQYKMANPPDSAEARATERYVKEVGAHLATLAKRKLNYQFHLVPDTSLINAFALPGGHVFVGQGLLDRITSEDELAFVLGHEIEHIDHYHAVERVQVEAQLKKLDLDLVGALAEIPISLWQAGYSKDEEMEADREGLRLAVAAGYSAKGAVNLLERWMKLRNEYVIHAENPTEELSQLAIDSLNGYFRTHPLPSERLAQAKEIIAQEQLPVDGPVKPIRIGYEIIADH